MGRTISGRGMAPVVRQMHRRGIVQPVNPYESTSSGLLERLCGRDAAATRSDQGRAGERGSKAAARPLRLEPPQAASSVECAHAPARPIQESDRPPSPVCHRVVVLPARSRQRLHHSRHRPRERPSRLLAGAQRNPRRGEVAGHGASQGHRAARREAPGHSGRRDRAGRYRHPERRGSRPGGLPGRRIQGPLCR